MPLGDFITVAITLDTIASTRPGFGIPMLAGVHSRFAERAKSYRRPSDMLADGFLTTDPLYLKAVALKAQNPSKGTFWIGRADTFVAQVATLTVGGNTDGDYTVQIDGTDYTFSASSSTATAIRDALVSAINGGSDPVTAAPVSTDQLTLTADKPGEPFVLALTSPGDVLTSVATTANVGWDTELAAIKAFTNDWYGLALDERDDDHILVGAAWAHTNNKLPVFQSDTAGIIDAGTSDDVASLLQDNTYDVVFAYHDDDSEHVDAAILGRMLPTDPGSATWHWKPLSGVTPAPVTSANVAALKAKNACWFEEIGSRNVFMNGICSSGQFADLIRAVDWLIANLELDLADLLASNDKIPFTDEGIAQVVATVRARLGDAAQRGIVVLDSITVTAPEAADVLTADKANRNLPDVEWEATVQGAIHSVDVAGVMAA